MPLNNRLFRRSLLASTAIVSVSVVSAAADPILSAPGQAFLINNATETSAVINSNVPSVSVTGNGTLEATHGYPGLFIQADISGNVTNSGTISADLSIGNTSYSTSPSFTTRIGALAAPAVIVNSDISGNITNSGTIDLQAQIQIKHAIQFIPSLLQFISQFEHEYEHEYEHE